MNGKDWQNSKIKEDFQMGKPIKQVTDLNLIAYLQTIGLKFLSSPKFSTRFTVFEFERTPELEEACLSFYERKAQVDALTFAENLRTIKAMVQEMRG
jgi:hypothetical protein